MRLAFIGFRHGHVMGLYRAARQRPDIEVVAAYEDDPASAGKLRADNAVELTHTEPETWRKLIADVPCEVVAIGDYFGRRGAIAIAALEAGKHVIADKPICTRLDELERIAQLAAAKRRSVGCLLDLRDTGVLRTMRRLVRDEQAIGDVHTMNFTAQHPLLLGSRPAWYFEEGKHGGTINDIGVHAFDAIPWLTGRSLAELTAARARNARLPQFPHFQDAGQLMLTLDNGGGVLGDVSYLAPDASGYAAPQYWRVTCHGTNGFVECGYDTRTLLLATNADKAVRPIDADPGTPGGVIDAFIREARGETPRPGDLTTADVLDASRKSLLIQNAADRGACGVRLA